MYFILSWGEPNLRQCPGCPWNCGYKGVLTALGLINNQDVTGCIRILDDVENGGRELSTICNRFYMVSKKPASVKTTENVNDIIIDMATENLMLLKQEAESMDVDILMRYIRIFSELSNQICYAPEKSSTGDGLN